MPDDDPGLLLDMRNAAEAYEQLLRLFDEGRFTEDEFRKGVMESCVLVRDQEAWLIDGHTGHWLHYNGVDVLDVGAETADVVLVDPGPDRVSVLRVLRELTGLELAEAKELMDSAPQPVLRDVPAARADEARRALEALGATVR